MLTLPESTSSPLSVRAKAMVFEDPASRELLARIERIAPTDAPVLITGETGTGKELVARHLHALSKRAAQPFLAVNAGAFSESLIESELFGHERGAFTGALTARVGWFEAANGGTLFLDEIGDLPLPLQVKLLRVLQEGEVVRVGSHVPRKIDVRFIAATNVDLRAAARAKQFREDLFYRLKVVSLGLPPLRERPGDILPLAQYFLGVYGKRLGRSGVTLGPDAQSRLLQHAWPGNIRELENTIHHATLVAERSELGAKDLHLEVIAPQVIGAASSEVVVLAPRLDLPSELPIVPDPFVSIEVAFAQLLEQKVPELYARVEASLFSAAYRHANHNQLETARLLGLSRHVVRARLLEQGALKGSGSRASGRRSSAPPPPNADLAPESARRVGLRGVVRVGYQRLGLLMWLKARGVLEAVFASRGMGIEWHEYPGGIQLVEALASGKVDIGGLGDCPAVFAQAQDVPIFYLAAEPAAPRGTALLVPSGSVVASVKELRGRRIAVNRAAQAHFLLLRALEEAAIDPSEIEILFAPPERALQAFRSGAVDAWSIWDPWLSNARLELGARVLRDSRGLMDNSVYYVATREFTRAQPDALQLLISELELTARWAEQDPAAASELVAHEFGFSADALRASLARELRLEPVTAVQLAAQQDIADVLWRLRLIPRAVSVADSRWDFKLAG